MPSVFTQILAGELPGRIVWKDELCFAILTNRPIRPGHALVIPRQEVDHWIDLEPALATHLFQVAQTVGRAMQHAFQPQKVGLTIAGLEVRHVHLHLIPIDQIADLDFARQDPHAQADALDEAAQRLRAALNTIDSRHVAH
jgi:histidine triad (HIT) family protein